MPAETPPTDASDPTQPRSAMGAALLVAGLVVLGVIAILLPVGELLTPMLEWVRSLGDLGPVLLVAVYAIATVLMVPGVLLTLAAGFLFGLAIGTLVVMAGSVGGAVLAFLAGRYLARGYVERLASRFPRFAIIDQAVEQRGFQVVLLTRLSPLLPFNVLNYLFGATRVSLGVYALASWIGMAPGTVMYVYFGAAAKDLPRLLRGEFEGGSGQAVLFFVGLAATVAVTLYATRIAADALRRHVPPSPDPPTTPRPDA